MISNKKICVCATLCNDCCVKCVPVCRIPREHGCVCLLIVVLTVCLFVESQGDRETIIVQNDPCNYEFFQVKLDHEVYSFTPDRDTTFLVYVYGFKTPFCLTVCICSSYHK